MAEQDTTFLVDFGSGGEHPVTHQVTALKPVYDERYFPGFIQMRNAAGDITALVPAAAQPLIRRRDSDPALASRPSAPKPVPRAPQARASRADLEQLAARGSKPGEV